MGFGVGPTALGLLVAGLVEADLVAAFSLLEAGVAIAIGRGVRPCQRGSFSVGYCLTTA